MTFSADTLNQRFRHIQECQLLCMHPHAARPSSPRHDTLVLSGLLEARAAVVRPAR